MAKNIIEIILKLTDQASAELAGVSKTFKAVGQNLTRAGKVMTLGVTAPLVAAGGLALKAASDYEQAMGAVETVFEDAGDAIKEYSKTSATAVGLSAANFSQLSVVTGAFLQNVGYSAGEAAKETINLTERAADMAATFNTDVTTALNAIQSGLKGEFNPLEQFGVKINAASIEAKAMAMGLAETTKALTDNDKAAAALALVYEQTNKIQGTFQKEADGVAGSMQILKAQFGDIAQQLGQHLIPIATEFLGILSKMVERFSNLTPAQQKFIVYTGMIVAAIGPILLVVGQAITAFGAISGVISTVSTFMSASLIPALAAAVPALGGIVAAAAPVILIIAAVGAAIYAMYLIWTKNLFGIQEKTAAALEYIKIAFNQFVSEWSQTWENIKQIIQIAWGRIVQIARDIVEGIKAAFKIDWGAVGRAIIDGIVSGIRNGIGAIKSAAKDAAQAALDAAKGFLGIQSPSKVMMELGQNMNLGMAAGIRGSMNVPVAAMAGTAAQTAAASQFGDVNINVHGNANNRMDITELAYQVAEVLGGL